MGFRSKIGEDTLGSVGDILGPVEEPGSGDPAYENDGDSDDFYGREPDDEALEGPDGVDSPEIGEPADQDIHSDSTSISDEGDHAESDGRSGTGSDGEHQGEHDAEHHAENQGDLQGDFDAEFEGGFVFDDDFVRAAEVKEPTAAERQRAARQANLQRLLQDREAQQENLLHEYRRLAPMPGDFDRSEDHDERPYDYDEYYNDEYFDYGDDGQFGDQGLGQDDWLLGVNREDYELGVRQRRQQRNRRVLVAVSVIVIISVVFVYALAQFFAGLGIRTANSARGPRTAGSEQSGATRDGSRNPGDPRDAESGAVTRPSDWPPLGEWPATPLGTPADVPAGGGPHAFLMLQADSSTPVAYDPCRVIHYVTHGLADAPASAGRRLRSPPAWA